MLTFFIYDTAYCKADEDDPKDAVLYFFPAEVYENQCYSLCCQIAGVAKFFKTTFSCPSIIAFDQEKFALHWSGKYLFVLGGNTDYHGNVLKQQLEFLCGIFCFYHGSINKLLKLCKNDRKEFLSRMELAWSRYITLCQCFNNLLCVPVNAIPLPFIKKYSEAVSKANELLRMCQLSASVIAGAVYCNSRVLLSQLSPELTSYLTLMSNENAALPVCKVPSSIKNLPPNVELKYVYISPRVIQNIIRHNHVYIGSSVRVKVDNRTPLSRTSHFYENLTSGSEGDVDSGHCTERVYQRKTNTSAILKPYMPSFSELNFKSQLLCCAMHAAVFRKDLLKCRNRMFRKYLNSEFVSEKLKNFKKKTSVQYKTNGKKISSSHNAGKEIMPDNKGSSCNLICYYHASVFSEIFLLNNINDHLNLSSTCDLEYSCYFCINNQFSNDSMSFLSKSWNSEMQIPEYIDHIPSKPHLSDYSSSSDRLKKEKTSKCKIQILKCRTKTGTCVHCSTRPYSCHSKRDCHGHVMCDPRNKVSKHRVNNFSQSSYHSEDYWKSVEDNDLEKTLLYVQRCENNVVLLLMNKTVDENILMYLWNCGFTFLKDLEYHIESKTSENNETDAVSYVMIHDNIQKVLKERPVYKTSMLADKSLKKTVLAIQEDLKSNPKMQMFSLLSTNQSVFACQTKQHSAFYLQQDLNSRRSESLCSLTKKAGRRLEKYLLSNDLIDLNTGIVLK